MHRWIEFKVETEGGPWKVFLANPEIIQFSHVQSCSLYKRHETVLKKKVIGIDDFRTFLVHFFAISILWVHFKNADEFPTSNDFGNMKLSFDEFKMAVKTLTATHQGEECSEEQLMKDFITIDHDQSNSLGFVEVCAHCCKYIDPLFDPNNPDQNTGLPANIQELQDKEDMQNLKLKQREEPPAVPFLSEITDVVEVLDIADDVLADLEEVSEVKRTGQFKTIKSRNLMAVDALQKELDREKAATQFAEVKYSTEAEIDALLKKI